MEHDDVIELTAEQVLSGDMEAVRAATPAAIADFVRAGLSEDVARDGIRAFLSSVEAYVRDNPDVAGVRISLGMSTIEPLRGDRHDQ